MSDEEEVMSGSEEEAAPTGPSEAEQAMQRRRAAPPKKIDAAGLDEEAQELLSANEELRAKLEEEIEELRERSERRKIERAEEEKQAAKRREEEEARRKKEEEERNAKKLAEEQERRAAREAKMAELDKYKNADKPNFVITKKAGAVVDAGDEGEEAEKKSKEQLEAEKRAILDQRIPKLEIAGFDSGKLTDKAKELHGLIHRLESEKYDLEKRFKAQQYDMMELAERARQMNKVGRGGLKRIQLGQEEVDVMSERFAGCPSKILMFSQFERQKDLRSYGDRKTVFNKAQFLPPPDRIAPKRMVKFNEAGLPQYEYLPGCTPDDEEE